MDSDADLEALCNLLDDDDEEENVRPAEAPVVASSSRPGNNEGGPEPSKTPASSQLSETDALKQQMAEMQKQMALLQQKLQNAESSSSSPQVHKGQLKESNFLTQDGVSASGAPRSPPRPKNPFEEIKVSDRVTQKFVDGNKFGPSLPKRSLDRKLEGEEKKELLAKLKAKDKERKEKMDYGLGASAALVAQDLRDSSDEEAERDPTSQKYNDYGLQIKRQLKQQQQEQQQHHRQGRQQPEQSKASFSNINGSHMNLSNRAANKPIQNLLHESHSKLRIANPLVDQTALNLSMVGRKMIPMQRLKTAILNKETEGMYGGVFTTSFWSLPTSQLFR